MIRYFSTVYPPEELSTIERAQRRLGRATLGMAMAGLGTLLLAPLAIRTAVIALRQPLDQPDRIRAWIVIFLSVVLFSISLFLG